MGYLERFARGPRGKERTEVLTARLPASLYRNFKAYCDELGLSISEAVYLLVDREMKGIESVEREISTTIEHGLNDDVVVMNTKLVEGEVNVVKKNTKVLNGNTVRKQINTSRFTTTDWQVDGELPCPVCGEWKNASNFSRHVTKQHNMTTEQALTNEEYKEKVNAMVEKRQGLPKEQE